MPSTPTLWGAVLAAFITAFATLGAAIGPRLFDNQSCRQFEERFDKISDSPDSKYKYRRLTALVDDDDNKKCKSYRQAVREQKALESVIEITNRRDPPRPGDPVITGLSYGEAGNAAPQPSPPSIMRRAASNPPVPIAPEANVPPVVAPANPSNSSETEARVPPAILEPYVPVKEEMPAPGQSKKLPDIVVRPIQTFDDPAIPFEGGIGRTLLMKGGKHYELRPARYNTTTYNVTKGKVVVEVNGKPYFACETGNTFRLFWKNKPDFFVSSPAAADVTVTNVQDGKHLSTSDCVDPSG